jgi:sodium-dependent dicarboxylate transporter 2/3/5
MEGGADPATQPSRARLATAFAIATVIAALAWTQIPSPLHARAAALAAVYLVLALTEIVPPFVPTLFLLAAAPLALGRLDARFESGRVLAWPADPVLALFAGGA